MKTQDCYFHNNIDQGHKKSRKLAEKRKQMATWKEKGKHISQMSNAETDCKKTETKGCQR